MLRFFERTASFHHARLMCSRVCEIFCIWGFAVDQRLPIRISYSNRYADRLFELISSRYRKAPSPPTNPSRVGLKCFPTQPVWCRWSTGWCITPRSSPRRRIVRTPDPAVLPAQPGNEGALDGRRARRRAVLRLPGTPGQTRLLVNKRASPIFARYFRPANKQVHAVTVRVLLAGRPADFAVRTKVSVSATAVLLYQ
jgi:hypothetical protein